MSCSQVYATTYLILNVKEIFRLNIYIYYCSFIGYELRADTDIDVCLETKFEKCCKEIFRSSII